MPRAVPLDLICRRRRYFPEIIDLSVRWYLTYRLSYRDLVVMMTEHGVSVSHTTILRWVLRYVPEYERRWGRYARPVNYSWRMDATAVTCEEGGIASTARWIDTEKPSIPCYVATAVWSRRGFFPDAVGSKGASWPTKINLDGNAATHRGLRLLADEDAGGPSRSACAATSTTSSSKIIARSRAVARRCSD